MTPIQRVQNLLKLDQDLYTAAELKAAVDEARTVVSLLPLIPVLGIFSGEPEYRTFSAGFGDWESDVIFYDSSYSLIVPIESDLVKGIWTFSSEPTRPVLISGSSVDVYEAAAQILDSLASESGEDLVSYSAQGGSFTTASKSRNYRALAQEFRNKQRLVTVGLIRRDL